MNTRRPVSAKDANPPIHARVPLVKRKRLELIQVQRGHSFLSDTLREAVDEYIAKYGSRRKAA